MTKNEALDLALEALELHGKQYPHMVKGYCLDAITAIKQALALDKMADNARELGLDYEPHKGLSEHLAQATNGRVYVDPVTGDVGIGAPVAPVQEPVGCEGAIVNGRVYADRLEHDYKFECEAGPLHLCNDWIEFCRCFEWLATHTTPPAAQRQWVGLTDEERDDLLDNYITAEGRAQAIEAKLKEKNNG